MSIETFGTLANVALIGALIVAITALEEGFRIPARARVAAVVCVTTVVGLVILGIAGYSSAMSGVFARVATTDAAERATLLARGISEAMNCAAFVALAAVAPSIAATILFFRKLPAAKN